MHLFFCSLPVSTLHPSPTTTTLAPSLSRQTALGVTAGITCRASGALPPANGLISFGGHPISPETDSLSFLSSLTRLCPDLSHECRDANAQDRKKKKAVHLSGVWDSAQLRIFVCLCTSHFFSAVFPLLMFEDSACGCLFFEKEIFLCDLESIVSLHAKFRCSHEKYGNSAESQIWIEMLYLYFTLMLSR